MANAQEGDQPPGGGAKAAAGPEGQADSAGALPLRPTTIVLFGATGDLAQRKLLPALFSNCIKGRLPEGSRIVGFARQKWSLDQFQEHVKEALKRHAPALFDAERWREFAVLLSYSAGDLERREDFEALEAHLRSLEAPEVSRVYYLAIAPRFYGSACRNLRDVGMTGEEQGGRRIVIEKPFGYDGQSAAELDRVVHSAFSEHQVFRIDHYIGKETTQNILFMRFANTMFEPIWNRRYVDHVQITVAEEVDVSNRAGYYDDTGVLRDMFQNHLMQLFALTAMEAPASLQADGVRNEKVKVMQSVEPVRLVDTVRGQYEGYREHEGVRPGSETPTYAALKLHLNTWRWQGVPFYLRSGKALGTKASEITVQFQRPPGALFDLPENGSHSNSVSICIQPDEGIHVEFQAKVPDEVQASQPVDMTFHYRHSFPDREIPDAYERLLLDAIRGDPSLFTRSDGIAAEWAVMDPIIEGWQNDPAASPLATYLRGSSGPVEADQLLAQSGHRWRLDCRHE
jgi:glucose-6-phosphate 1-dehydrogenase